MYDHLMALKVGLILYFFNLAVPGNDERLLEYPLHRPYIQTILNEEQMNSEDINVETVNEIDVGVLLTQHLRLIKLASTLTSRYSL